MQVYLDNAATTALLPEVFDAMRPYYLEHFGNPSSIHNFGRIAKASVENARKKIAGLLNAAPSEIFFTSGGTEADNWAIVRGINTFNLKHIITSPLEHHAVLHTVEHLEKTYEVKVHYVRVSDKGEIDFQDLKYLLENNPNALVSLMHANNEIGNLIDLNQVATICKSYNALFHSDTVQTIGHVPIDLQKIDLFSLTGSAHKFHGPKGIGFIYLNSDHFIKPLIFGGAQERNLRGGTENVAAIVGMAKALEIAYQNLEQDKKHITLLKNTLAEKLLSRIPGAEINGAGIEDNKSLYTILNIGLPTTGDNDMLIFGLDINHIAVSAGSACASGSSIGSHVLQAMGVGEDKDAIRFSFSKFNTLEEIDYVVEKVTALYVDI
jgi:cysteine desulfurase